MDLYSDPSHFTTTLINTAARKARKESRIHQGMDKIVKKTVLNRKMHRQRPVQATSGYLLFNLVGYFQNNDITTIQQATADQFCGAGVKETSPHAPRIELRYDDGDPFIGAKLL